MDSTRLHSISAALLTLAFLASTPASAQTLLHQFEGTIHGDRLGSAVSPAGDFDGDGHSDFAIGARGFGPGGRVQIHSGATGTVLWSMVDTTPGQGLGSALDLAGDVDADGKVDLIIGDKDGRAIVVSGTTGGILHDLSLGGSDGDGDFGTSVAGVGDLDQDGHDDFAVGAPTEGPFGARPGSVHVYSGATGVELYHWQGDVDGQRFGGSVDGAGDVDADGIPDVIAGHWAPTGPRWARIFSGLDGSLIRQLDGTGAFGLAVLGAGDLNGDGHADAVVGDVGAGPGNLGAAHAFSGADGSLLWTLAGWQQFQSLGGSLATGEDIDGDGVPELLVGSSLLEWFATYDLGGVHLVSGASGQILFTAYGIQEDSDAGFSCAWLGDVDQDGSPDFAVGGPGRSPSWTNGGNVTIHSTTCAGTVPFFGCSSSPNSAGAGARIAYTGSTSLSANDLVLRATGLPPNTFGLFFWGPLPDDVPFGDGRLCIRGPLVRVNAPVVSTLAGTAQSPADLANSPSPLPPGSNPHFQLFYRDTAPVGGSGFNTSDLVRLTVCP